MDYKRIIRRSTSNQFEKLVDHLEESSYLVSGIGQTSTQFGYSKSKAEVAWENIAESLNSIGPPRRTVFEWKKTWSDLKKRTKQNILEINKCDLYFTEGRTKPLSPLEVRVAKLCKFKPPQPLYKSCLPTSTPTCKVAVVTPNISSTVSTASEVSPSDEITLSVSSAPETKSSPERVQKTAKRKINRKKKKAYVKELELLRKQVATQEAIVGVMESQVKSAEEHNKSLKEIAEASKLIASSISAFIKQLQK